MENDWFPFFSMLFWCATKIAGLALFVTGLIGLGSTLIGGFDFGQLLLLVALPFVVGYVLLTSDIVYELGVAAQQRRRRAGK